MFTRFSAAVMAALIVPANAGISSSTEPPQIYVQLIVKACPSNQPETQMGRPDAVRGYHAEPISQGGDYERSPTRAERESAFATMHCIDVPVPP